MNAQPSAQIPFADLPEGTVTFLFTDIEGSTELLHRLRERFAACWQTSAASCARRLPMPGLGEARVECLPFRSNHGSSTYDCQQVILP
jgi:hypothetical protein